MTTTISGAELDAIKDHLFGALGWEVVAAMTVELNGATGGIDVTFTGFKSEDVLDELTVTFQIDNQGWRIAA